MDEVKTEQDLSDIIDIIELSVKVFALQKLAELVEHKQSITRVRLFDMILPRASWCVWDVHIVLSYGGFFQKLDVSLLALKGADWMASVLTVEVC